MSSAVDGATPLFTVQIDIDCGPDPGSCEMGCAGWVQIAGRIGGREGLERVEVSDCS